MLPKNIKQAIIKEDRNFMGGGSSFEMPIYNSSRHYKDLCNSDYYRALVVLRHFIKVVSDYYFGTKENAKNIDLFMLTSSVSSPIGPGSDSEPIIINLGELKTYLVDSSQFGFEPLLLNNFDKVYCYLPSMRGENCDERHLNQFYHCEMEMKGELEQLFPIVEGYIKILAEAILLMDNIVNKISSDSAKTKQFLRIIIDTKNLPRITFDEAINILIKNNKKELVNFTNQGNDISNDGELELMRILQLDTPVWLTNFDRDRVPFYQKIDPLNQNKTLNADLLFPQIIMDSFGGEIIGAGQRQDNPEEIYESLKRQNHISSQPYEWYIDLRRQPGYTTTSGFGMGIERFIAWALGKDNVRDVILYPRIKNVKTYP